LKNAAETSVGKATTAIHLAAYLQTLALTLLVDGDVIRASTKWSKRGDGKGLPFMVMPVAQMDEFTDENLGVIVKKTQTAIPKDQIDRIDARPPQRRHPRAEPCGLIEGR
jgi:chromosome partitioning protein